MNGVVMRRHVIACAAAAAAALGGIARPAVAARKCTDIPLRVSIYSQALVESTNSWLPSAILPDAGGQYIDGVNASASIKVCSGTNDAVVNVSGTRRMFTLVFNAPLPASVIQTVPSWVPGTYAASGWINIRNLRFSKIAFATMAGATFSVSGDRAT